MDPYVEKDAQLLSEILTILDERKQGIEQYIRHLHLISDLKQKIQNQLEQIDTAWDALIAEEKKECDMITAEREHVESQMKNESLLGSKESLHRSALDLSSKSNKPAPSRVGNYTIMAKRLQGEIKDLEKQASDMKAKLDLEIENRISLENKVRELRSHLCLHRKHDIFTNPSTPV